MGVGQEPPGGRAVELGWTGETAGILAAGFHC